MVAHALLAAAIAQLSPALAGDKSVTRLEGDNPNMREPLPGDDSSAKSIRKPRKNADWNKLSDAFEKLVLEYYPKAQIEKKSNSLHAELKVKPYQNATTLRWERGPGRNGILLDVSLVPGIYTGVHAVPKKFNEYTGYYVILYAPYSKDYDRHLLTRLAYPYDAPEEFQIRIQKLVNEFEKHL
ncbi:MAG TPA: hypothetical protein V6D17_05535 [Candidatus Obscuribacterales bacterium]